MYMYIYIYIYIDRYNAVTSSFRHGINFAGSLEDVRDAYHTLEGRGYRRLTPHFIPRCSVDRESGTSM